MEVLILYNWERKTISKQLYWKLVHSFIFTREELIADEIRSIRYGMSLTIPWVDLQLSAIIADELSSGPKDRSIGPSLSPKLLPHKLPHLRIVPLTLKDSGPLQETNNACWPYLRVQKAGKGMLFFLPFSIVLVRVLTWSCSFLITLSFMSNSSSRSYRNQKKQRHLLQSILICVLVTTSLT